MTNFFSLYVELYQDICLSGYLARAKTGRKSREDRLTRLRSHANLRVKLCQSRFHRRVNNRILLRQTRHVLYLVG